MTKYRDYITSDEWREFRIKYYETHKKECRACGSKLKVNLHHKTYKRLGAERLADVVPLCEYHHSELHKKVRKNKLNLWTATEEYIRNVRKVRNSKRVVKKNPRKKKYGNRGQGNPRQRKR